MSTTGYIFWCSKCKRDHAGECQVTISIKMPVKQEFFIHYAKAPAAPAPPNPGYKIGYSVPVGSLWTMDDYLWGNWRPRQNGYYEVLAVSGTQVTVRSPKGNTYTDFHVDGFSPTGYSDPSHNAHYRMVPKP